MRVGSRLIMDGALKEFSHDECALYLIVMGKKMRRAKVEPAKSL